MKWSVGIQTEGDRVISREEIVELADAVAPSSGVASGIGTNRYGATLVVEARSRDEAIERATAEFTRAAAKAGLPGFPIVRIEAVGEDEDAEDEGVGARDSGAGDTRARDTRAGDIGGGDTGTGDSGGGDISGGDIRAGDSGTGDSGGEDTRGGNTGTGDTRAGDSGGGDIRGGSTGTGDVAG